MTPAEWNHVRAESLRLFGLALDNLESMLVEKPTINPPDAPIHPNHTETSADDAVEDEGVIVDTSHSVDRLMDLTYDQEVLEEITRLYGRNPSLEATANFISRYRLHWSQNELGMLVSMADSGSTVEEISRKLYRSYKAVSKQLWKLGYRIDEATNIPYRTHK